MSNKVGPQSELLRFMHENNATVVVALDDDGVPRLIGDAHEHLRVYEEHQYVGALRSMIGRQYVWFDPKRRQRTYHLTRFGTDAAVRLIAKQTAA